MGKSRLEAFSDGVIAIIIIIMVLELKPPHGAEFRELLPLWPVFMSYVLSFVYIGIYWNKHQQTPSPRARPPCHQRRSGSSSPRSALWSSSYMSSSSCPSSPRGKPSRANQPR